MNKLRPALSNFFLILFLLSIPTQLGKHFWPEWSYVFGIRVDYLSPILYLSDIVWLIWLSFNLNIIKKNIKANKTIWVLALLFVGVNISGATVWPVAVYKWLRVMQIVLTAAVLKEQKKIVWKNLKIALPFWIVLEVFLGLAQVIKGGSLNGIFYWLGERKFSFTTIGIAQIRWWDNGTVRAYGTFSHPNSLAGFLLVCLVLWQQYRYGFKKRWQIIGWWIIDWLIILGIIITGSRLIWLMTFGIWVFYILKGLRNKLKIWGAILMLLGLVYIVFGVLRVNYTHDLIVGGWDENSWEKRLMLNTAALKMAWENPVLGVGLGNFINSLPYYQKENPYFWLQPVHNIFLLLLSETGLFVFLAVIWWLVRMIRRNLMTTDKLLLLAILTITGMWDHYWFTLPQNGWLLAVILALI